MIISYPTGASRIIVLLKTATKYRQFFPTLFVKTTDFQLVFDFEQRRTVTIFGEPGIMAHILRFHCHAINTAQKNTFETVQWKKPRK